MNIVQTRGVLMADYARGISERLSNADRALRQAVVDGDTQALLIGMAEREASLAATEDLVSELDLSGLSAVEHAAIIRLMVQALERSQVAQAALEAEMFRADRLLDSRPPEAHPVHRLTLTLKSVPVAPILHRMRRYQPCLSNPAGPADAKIEGTGPSRPSPIIVRADEDDALSAERLIELRRRVSILFAATCSAG